MSPVATRVLSDVFVLRGTAGQKVFSPFEAIMDDGVIKEGVYGNVRSKSIKGKDGGW